MAMGRRRKQLQAYLAGIVDGEGSFGIYDLESWQGRLTVNMQDPEAILLFKRLYPEGTFSAHRKGPDGKIAYTVVYSQHRAYQVTKDLLPFLIIKHRQAKVLISFLVHRRRDRNHQKKNSGLHDCPRCKQCAENIKAIRREAKGKNSVNALLDHGMREYRAERAEVEEDVKFLNDLLEGVETRLRATPPNKAASLPEQEIVQAAA